MKVILLYSLSIVLLLILLINFGNNILDPSFALNSLKEDIITSEKINDEHYQTFSNKKIGPIINKTMTGYDKPILSDLQEKRIEKAIDESFISKKIPIFNSTISNPRNDNRLSSQFSNINNTNIGSIFEKDKNETYIFANDNIETNASFIESYNFPQILLFTPDRSTADKVYSFKVEPSIAAHGNTILLTGNHFVVLSKDKGVSWLYLNVTEVMPDFCCDQDVIYDPNHKIFLWYRQGNFDCNGENRAVIGVSSDGFNWRFMDILPTDLDPTLRNTWFDYPQIALGNNFLYITTNLFSVDVDSIESCSTGQGGDLVWKDGLKKDSQQSHSIIMRIPLDELSKSSNTSIPKIDGLMEKTTDRFLTFTPVQGSKNTMYWATHDDNQHLRIYTWNETHPPSAINYYNIKLPEPWIPLYDSKAWKTQHYCPINNEYKKDSRLWCQEADSRISSGWISNDVIGFLWNAGTDAKSHPDPKNALRNNYPYIEGALFNVSDNMQYLGKPSLYSDQYAWLYGYAMPNQNGDVAVIASYGGGQHYPSVSVGIGKDIKDFNSNNSQVFWQMIPMLDGLAAPTETINKKKIAYGDYLRLRSYDHDSWIGTGFSIDKGGTQKDIKTRIVIFDKNATTYLSELKS